MQRCLLCGRKAKYICDGGCKDDEVAYCGYCCRRKIVVWIGTALEQRLCAVCALRGDRPKENGIFDARYFTLEQVRAWLEIDE